MKILKVIGLSLMIWASSLLWPSLGQRFAQSLSLGLVAGLGLVGLALIGLIYFLEQRLGNDHNNGQPGLHTQIPQPLLAPVTKPSHSHPTQPITIVTSPTASRPTRPIAI